MKILFFLLSITVIVNAQYYISPDGNDNNDGSIYSPFLTIRKAFDAVKTKGDTIYIREGSYAQNSTLETPISGSEAATKNLWAYPGEHPIIDFSGQPYSSSSRGIKLNEDYWHIKGIEIKNAGDNGIHISGHHNIVEDCSLHHNKDTGLQISNGGSYNRIINCDSYLNYDPNSHGENADGFAPKLDIGPGNYFKNCRAYYNSDDGWDCYEGQNQIIIDSCWAYHNGFNIWDDSSFQGDGNGFKLGGNYISAPHIIKNSIAFDNKSKGFDQNHNTAGITVFNCTGYRNGRNYSFSEKPNDGSHILKNNISFNADVSINSSSIQESNSWNGFSISEIDFESIDTSLAYLDRNQDNLIIETDFLRLSSASAMIDAGVDVGIEFMGLAPDLGAFEFNNKTDINGTKENITEFQLMQNYPNPFNLSTQINFSISKRSFVELYIYNILGEKIIQLFSGNKEVGEHSMEWNGFTESGNVAISGIYIITLKSNNTLATRKMILLK